MSAEPPDAAPAAPPADTSAGAPDATPVALARYRVLVPHLYDGVTLKAAAASGGVPYRTAQRWLAAWTACRPWPGPIAPTRGGAGYLRS
ncbi:helix-turn-helix domain-containing protein [Nonomuraea angiospora]|uniref:helix-turn-helix domain-containing protein n=1 Tax=Nonomuraea angiospora TaxID=46172 RepID=UPI00379887C9